MDLVSAYIGPLMKTKYVIAIFFSSLAAGAALIWLLSNGQTPIVITEPTQFSSQKAIGAAVFDKLGQSVLERKIFVIGIPPQPESYQGIVFGFLEKLAAVEPKLIVLKEPKWPDLPADLNIENYDFVFSDEDLSVESETVQRALASGHTLVIYSVNIFTTHLIADNPIKRFEKAMKGNLISLSVGQLSLRQNGEHKIDPACVGSMRDLQGLYDLGCALLANSRKHYRKLLPLNKPTALLVRQSEEDYLLQVYYPD